MAYSDEEIEKLIGYSDEEIEKLMGGLTDDERVAVTFDRLTAIKRRDEIEALAMMLVVHATQAVRMRAALQYIATNDKIDRLKFARTFARDALSFADEFTEAEVLSARARVHGGAH